MGISSGQQGKGVIIVNPSLTVRPASEVSRRINAERLLLIAWLRAMLLQFAHPLIAAGVAEHSRFRGGTSAAFARLRHTVEAMLALTYGTESERDAALDSILTIHRRVNGTLTTSCGAFAAGTRYSAEDSALLTWVHATLIESTVLVYEQLVEPLTAVERDRYCDDAAEVAIALGASSDAVPRSWSSVRAYVERRCMSGEIAVGQQALLLAAALVSPGGGRVSRSLLAPAMSLVAAGLLPPHVRKQYGFTWNRRRERGFMRIVTLLRLIRRVLPLRLTQWRRARLRDGTALHHDYSAAAR
jgi:uncharacterized protein (DUF2236 family)